MPSPESAPFHWRQLESTNYLTYVANLRRIGCPAQTIRDLISAEVRAALNSISTQSEPAWAAWRDDSDQLIEYILKPEPVLLRQLAADPAASRRSERIEEVHRSWTRDFVVTQYGQDTFLDWEREATGNGMSLQDYLGSMQIQVPSPPTELQQQ
jgi:hypothetical protein